MVIYSFSKEAVHEGNLILVNRDHPLKLRRQFRSSELTMVDRRFPEILLRNVAASHLKNIFQKIGSDEKIVPVSGYRSLKEQTELFETSWLENGEEYTKKFVARPNQSEHQTGLAIDVAEYSEQIDFICPEFSYDGIAMKFREMAAEYGFVERYPKGKEEITGIAHEPWHFRYVGVPHSRIMTAFHMTLEEYVTYLKQFPYAQLPNSIQDGGYQLTQGLLYQRGYSEYHIYYMKAEAERTIISLPPDCEFDISGNNEDGFILTIKKACDTKWNQERFLLNARRRMTEQPMLADKLVPTEVAVMTVENQSMEKAVLSSELVSMEKAVLSSELVSMEVAVMAGENQSMEKAVLSSEHVSMEDPVLSSEPMPMEDPMLEEALALTDEPVLTDDPVLTGGKKS